ncbi:hypothetical protein FXO38_25514 [Capsicum annuum]|nr:hypothetical protein FXO38_25514 [Capsicum annuum]
MVAYTLPSSDLTTTLGMLLLSLGLTVIIRRKAQWIARTLYRIFGGILDECKTNYLKMETLASHVMQFLEGGNTSSRFNYELDDSFLLEYMDCLDQNLNDVLLCMDYLEVLKENRFLKQVKIIQKKMRFLRYLYAREINRYVNHGKLELSNHVINGIKLDEILVKIGAITGDVLYVIQKLLPSSINKDISRKVSLCSIQILEKTKDLKAQMETYFKSLKFTPSQFLGVGGLSFLDSLLRKLNKMLKSESGLDFIMKPNIGILEKEFSAFISILKKELSSLPWIFRDVAKLHHEHENLKDLQRHTINFGV